MFQAHFFVEVGQGSLGPFALCARQRMKRLTLMRRNTGRKTQTAL